MSHRKQITINIVSQIVSFAVSLAINFFLVPFTVEKIGKEVYGFFGLANNFLEYVTVITVAVNGMANRFITVAYSKGEMAEAKKYFTSVTVANVFLTAVLSVPAALTVLFLDKFTSVPAKNALDIKVLWALIFIMFFVNLIFSRFDVAPFAKNRLEITSLVNVSSVLSKAAVIALLYLFFKPYLYYVGIAALVSGLLSAALKVFFKKKLMPDLAFDKKLFDFGAVKTLLAVGIWNSASQLSQILFTGLDLLLANLFIGAYDMSLLSVAKTLPVMIIGFVGVVAGAFYPSMTICYSTRPKEDLLKETAFAMSLCGLILSVPVVGIAAFGKSFFALWLPSMTAEEITTIYILTMLTLLPQTLSIYIFPLYQINTLTCKVKVPALVDCAIGAINVGAVFLLLKYTSLGLFAIAGVSSLLLLLRIAFFVPMYASSNLGVSKLAFYPVLLKGLLLNIVMFAAFYGIKSLFPINSWIMLITAAAVCALLGYTLGFFALFSREEKKKVTGFFADKFKK
ncbi:MAG: MATE family efflux transporter [Clostridiales bacterium]|nr:MATE family efflux transporter [Clostridia bacterium]MCR5353910.1 MATE family efflux transporter [Clostridiales bacterium]